MTATPVTFVECDVPAGQDIVSLIHHEIPGPVTVVGITAEGEQIGVIANPITDIEVEVVDPTGTAVRLRATPADPADDEDTSPAREGMHVRH